MSGQKRKSAAKAAAAISAYYHDEKEDESVLHWEITAGNPFGVPVFCSMPQSLRVSALDWGLIEALHYLKEASPRIFVLSDSSSFPQVESFSHQGTLEGAAAEEFRTSIVGELTYDGGHDDSNTWSLTEKDGSVWLDVDPVTLVLGFERTFQGANMKSRIQLMQSKYNELQYLFSDLSSVLAEITEEEHKIMRARMSLPFFGKPKRIVLQYQVSK